MKNFLKITALFGTCFAIAACTDAHKAKFGAYGDSARVVCFSGGVKTFDDFSTGKVENEENSDGYAFVARSTNRLVQVSGDCNLDYGAKVPADFKPVQASGAAAR